MSEVEIARLVTEKIPDAQVEVQSNGNSYMVRVVSADFENLRALKRQQLVYSCLNEKIKSGEMHAVTMRLFTPEEWKKEQRFSL